MSNNVNTEIIERAREASEEATNTMLGAQLEMAIARNDLEAMQELTRAVERHLTYLDTIRDSEVG
jgi:hypothetical protein